MRSQTGLRAFAWVALTPTLVLAQPTASGEPTLGLRFDDPNGLAATTEAELEARLAERLGHPAFTSNATPDKLVVSWLGTPEQCRIELQLLQGVKILGTRGIESPTGDCKSLVPALLTVAALLIESREVEPPPPPPPPPAPPPPPLESEPPQSAATTPHESTVLISVGAALLSGMAPKVEFGPAVAVVLKPWRYARVGIQGSLFLQRQYDNAPAFSLGHDSVSLLACGMPLLLDSFSLGVCADGTLHRYRSEGVSLAHPRSEATSTWSTGLGLRAEWRMTRELSWTASVDANLALPPLYFYFVSREGNENQLFEQARVSPASFLGLTLELP